MQPGMDERPRWVISGACRTHLRIIFAQAKDDIYDNPDAGPHKLSPSVDEALDWVHSADRCSIDYISVITPCSQG